MNKAKVNPDLNVDVDLNVDTDVDLKSNSKTKFKSNYVLKKSVDDRIIDTVEDMGEGAIIVGKKVSKVSKQIGGNVGEFYTGWRKFVFKDSIINIAVGMIVARSFKNTVNSLVVDIIMPLLIGFGVGTNVHDLFIVLVHGSDKMINNNTYRGDGGDGSGGGESGEVDGGYYEYITLEQAKADGAVTLNYGVFINIFFDLMFVTLCLYICLFIIEKCKKKARKIKDEIDELI